MNHPQMHSIRRFSLLPQHYTPSSRLYEVLPYHFIISDLILPIVVDTTSKYTTTPSPYDQSNATQPSTRPHSVQQHPSAPSISVPYLPQFECAQTDTQCTQLALYLTSMTNPVPPNLTPHPPSLYPTGLHLQLKKINNKKGYCFINPSSTFISTPGQPPY